MTVPINAVSWSLGGLALYTFSVKGWRSYRLTRNPLGQIYLVLGLTFGTALFFFGVPGLFTRDTHILRITYFFADLFVQITMQVGIWMLWFLGLRNRVRLDYIYLLTIPFSAILMTLQALTSEVAYSASQNLIIYSDRTSVLILKSIIYVAVAVPIGYFLLRQAPLQTSAKAKLKSFMAGMTFLVICVAATSNNIFDNGSDTPTSSAVVAVFFLIFFLSQLPRPVRRTSR
ncbi:MAG: hypothetical protein ACREJM_15380 [Candidatus Saccharimonadales bacterium]